MVHEWTAPELRQYGYQTNWKLQGLTPEGAWKTYGGVFLPTVPSDFPTYVSREATCYPHILAWRILDTSTNTVLANTEEN